MIRSILFSDSFRHVQLSRRFISLSTASLYRPHFSFHSFMDSLATFYFQDIREIQHNLVTHQMKDTEDRTIVKL